MIDARPKAFSEYKGLPETKQRKVRPDLKQRHAASGFSAPAATKTKAAVVFPHHRCCHLAGAVARQRPPCTRLLLPGALLVPVQTQLLAAFVFVDFRLTTFFYGTHILIFWFYEKSINHLVQWILDDAFSTRRLQRRDDFAHHALVDDRFHRHPADKAQIGDGRIPQGRQAA